MLMAGALELAGASSVNGAAAEETAVDGARAGGGCSVNNMGTGQAHGVSKAACVGGCR
jgi:hypothetical protein